jgi:hypothetical protein
MKIPLSLSKTWIKTVVPVIGAGVFLNHSGKNGLIRVAQTVAIPITIAISMLMMEIFVVVERVLLDFP